MKIIRNISDVENLLGTELGLSDWIEIDQNRINDFAKSTLDFQWIHTDPEKASKTVLNKTIAHGYLIISLIPAMASTIYKVENLKMGINYGLNKVRFLNPLVVNNSIRLRSKLIRCEQKNDDFLLFFEQRIEEQDSLKEVCYAETITLFRF